MTDNGIQRFDSEMNLTPGNGGNRLLTVLVVVSTLTAVVAIVIAAVALTRPSNPNITVGGMPGGAPAPPVTVVSSGGSSAVSPVNKQWNIAIGHDWGAYEYFDSKGYIKGFSKDLIAAVCQAGGMDCNIIWAPYTQCWDSEPGVHPYGGPGLMDRWYDACTGWVATTDRIHVFDFSLPYLVVSPSYFYVKKGVSFDASDLSGKTIAFFTGWFNDEKCLARHEDNSHKNYKLTTEHIIYADTPEIAMQKLLSSGSDKVDAIFSSPDAMEKFGDQVDLVQGYQLTCDVSGNSMMFRKDSQFGAAWNRGFQKLRSSGRFQQLCKDSFDIHGSEGSLNCID